MEYIEKTDTYELLSFENWEKKYKPIHNPRSKDNIFFCTHTEEDIKFLKENQVDDSLNIWTLVDGGNECWIDSGWRWIDRMEYLITEIPRESKDILVQAEY